MLLYIQTFFVYNFIHRYTKKTKSLCTYNTYMKVEMKQVENIFFFF